MKSIQEWEGLLQSSKHSSSDYSWHHLQLQNRDMGRNVLGIDLVCISGRMLISWMYASDCMMRLTFFIVCIVSIHLCLCTYIRKNAYQLSSKQSIIAGFVEIQNTMRHQSWAHIGAVKSLATYYFAFSKASLIISIIILKLRISNFKQCSKLNMFCKNICWNYSLFYLFQHNVFASCLNALFWNSLSLNMSIRISAGRSPCALLSVLERQHHVCPKPCVVN